MRRSQAHDVQGRKLRNGQHEHGRDDGEILGHVVGNGKGGQRAPGHDQLFADFNDFNKFCGIAVQIHHIAGFSGGLGAGIHGHADVRLGQGRGVVGAVAHHRDKAALGLFPLDVVELVLGLGFSDEVINARFPGNGLGRERIVARDHDDADTHGPQAGKTAVNAGLEHVGQSDHTQHIAVVQHHQRRCAATGHRRDQTGQSVRQGLAFLDQQAFDGIGSALAVQIAVGQFQAAQAGLGRKGNQSGPGRRLRFQRGPLIQQFFAQSHNGFSLRSLVAERGVHGRARQLQRLHAGQWKELRGLTVAHGNGAGLVQQKGVDIPGQFHGLAALGQHIGRQSPVHARQTDGRQQRADGGGDQADQQGSQPGNGQVDVKIARHGPERAGHQHEGQAQTGQHHGEGQFIGRLLARCALHQRDHPVQKGLAGHGRDPDHNTV